MDVVTMIHDHIFYGTGLAGTGGRVSDRAPGAGVRRHLEAAPPGQTGAGRGRLVAHAKQLDRTLCEIDERFGAERREWVMMELEYAGAPACAP